MKKSFFKSDRGQAAVETAFVMPFLLFLYFSMQDLTALITFNRRITATAATVGDTVSQFSTTILKSDVDDIFNSVSMIMSPTPATDVHVDVYDYYLNVTTVTKRWSHGNGNGPTCSAPNTSNFASLMVNGNDLVVGVACMSYTPFIATFMGTNLLGSTSFLLNQTVTTRPRTSLSLNCVTAKGGSTVCT